MTKKMVPPEEPIVFLPDLLTVEEIQQRLNIIFPLEFPDRGILVGIMSARVVFVFLYGGFIEGAENYLRPSNVYKFTVDQSILTQKKDRQDWIAIANKPGYEPKGQRWYADNSRESIRDDLIKNRFHHLGIVHKLPGYPTTSSKPIYCLSNSFASLFNPAFMGDELFSIIADWSNAHLDKTTLQRMALRAQGIQSKGGDVYVNMPDGTKIRISAGPSSDILKGLIEDYAVIHLESPAVLWISASDKKTSPYFVELAKFVGLEFNPSNELPDLILADMNEPAKFIFCEVVATDGAVTEVRKEALLSLVKSSNIPVNAVKFLSAFEDRESSVFKKNFSQLALNSQVWFRTEPNLVVTLRSCDRIIK